jgi:hypothetical protein
MDASSMRTRQVKVIKRAADVERASESDLHVHRHELAMLHLLVKRHPDEAVKLVKITIAQPQDLVSN